MPQWNVIIASLSSLSRARTRGPAMGTSHLRTSYPSHLDIMAQSAIPYVQKLTSSTI